MKRPLGAFLSVKCITKILPFLSFINETTSYFAKILSLAILDHPPKGILKTLIFFLEFQYHPSRI
jgi:hypothetical protein